MYKEKFGNKKNNGNSSCFFLLLIGWFIECMCLNIMSFMMSKKIVIL